MSTPLGSRCSTEPRIRRSASAHRPDWTDSILVEKRPLPTLGKSMSERTPTLKKIYGAGSTNLSLPPIQRSVSRIQSGSLQNKMQQSRSTTSNGRCVMNLSTASSSSRSSQHKPSDRSLHELLNVVSFLKTNCKQLKKENENLNSQMREMKQHHVVEQASAEAFENKQKNLEKQWNRQIVEFSELKQTFAQQSKFLVQREEEIRTLRVDGLRSRINELRATIGRGIAEAFRLNASVVSLNYSGSPGQNGNVNEDHLPFTKDLTRQKMQQLSELLLDCDSRIRTLTKEAQQLTSDDDSDDETNDSLSKLLEKLRGEQENFQRQCNQIAKNIEKMKVADATTNEESTNDSVIADFIVLLQTHKKRLQILKQLDDSKEHDFVPRHFSKRKSDSLSSPEK
ncbi:hypothetical protein QR680_002167 [Steinernema hermaphroditum]|uniref:Uncharacterized protein n=1 Tax=Steinernema hermaphroditum TaxID=289476 RepID=A0AA39LHL7_9BILA|nr:hypothetical protein QR680_002167 [Steinernema hermaphroditum]